MRANYHGSIFTPSQLSAGNPECAPVKECSLNAVPHLTAERQREAAHWGGLRKQDAYKAEIHKAKLMTLLGANYLEPETHAPKTSVSSGSVPSLSVFVNH